MPGAHATYHTSPPKTRTVHGRIDAISGLDDWFESGSPCMVIHGIAGIGKSTLVANWLGDHMYEVPHLSVCWYPCQPWDKAVGLAVSLLHRFGVDDKHDPYQLMENSTAYSWCRIRRRFVATQITRIPHGCTSYQREVRRRIRWSTAILANRFG